MKKLLLGLLLFFIFFQSKATHIVGGELVMSHVSGNRYKVSLIKYFDAVNGNPAAAYATVIVQVFSKKDNRFIQTLTLPQVSNNFVNYTNPACGIGDLVTRRIEYTLEVAMNLSQYQDAEGYYMSWERCCRNGVIDNIVNPGNAGQTMYLEFPALVRNGQRFINSSPQLFPPLSDYACVGKPFYFDFSGKDPDGDSLVYSLSTPLRGFSSVQDPRPESPKAAPYPTVTWRNGYSDAIMIQGNPALNIDKKGMLRVTPSRAGLFVFAVKCEEYRKGVKIGEVRRDFQMLVVNCKVSSPPVATVIDPKGGNYNERDTIVVRIKDNKCFTIKVTDPDVGEIKAKILPIAGYTAGSLNIKSGFIETAGASINLTACFPECTTLKPALYGMDIVVEDNNCSLPLQDTIRMFLKVLPDTNNIPTVVSNLPFVSANKSYEIEVVQGEQFNFTITGDDKDKDSIAVRILGKDFQTGLGMRFTNLLGKPPLTGNFNWKVLCQTDTTTKKYEFYFVASDTRKCGDSKTDTTKVKVTVLPKRKKNEKPITTFKVSYDSLKKIYSDTIILGKNFSIPISVTDKDKDSLGLSMFMKGIDYKGLGIGFSSVSGKPSISSALSWQTNCNTLDQKDSIKVFETYWIAQDYDLCGKPLSQDTTVLRLVVKREKNTPPKFVSSLKYDQKTKIFIDSLYAGDTLRFSLGGTDLEKDSILIKLNGLTANLKEIGINFTTITGKAPLTAFITWATSCNLLTYPDSARVFNFSAKINEFRTCDTLKTDSVVLRLVLLPRKHPNTPPFVSANMSFDSKTKIFVDTVDVGNKVNFEITANDTEKDSLWLAGFAENFNLKNFGLNFSTISGVPILKKTVSWQTSCKDLDSLRFGVYYKTYNMTWISQDENNEFCLGKTSDTIKVRIVIRFNPEKNQKPKIEVQNASNTPQNGQIYLLDAGQSVQLKLKGTDADKDSISITAFGVGFNLADLDMKFTSVGGYPDLNTDFSWKTDCKFLRGNPNPQDFQVKFVVRDFNACDQITSDTITQTFRVTPLKNPNAPKIVANGIGTENKKTYQIKTIPNQSIDFEVVGTDADQDNISITGSGVGFGFSDFQMKFQDVNGKPAQSSRFTWLPSCEIFKNRQDFQVRFIVKDQSACGLDKADTIFVNIKLEDVASSPNFSPANVFTPNNDGKNDSFKIPNLPPDNCDDVFEKIEIYNRWGKIVFNSNLRGFEWDGAGFPDGVYFYTIYFKKRQFKGTVSKLGGTN